VYIQEVNQKALRMMISWIQRLRLTALNRARAFPLLLLDSDSFNCIYSFTKRIKIFLIYDTIASTNCNSVYASCFTLTYTSAAVVPSDPLITTTWYTGLVGDAL